MAAATLVLVAAAPAGGATASRAACPGQGNASAPPAAQERAMLCLVNRARSARGLDPLAAVTPLVRAADRKSGDILRCDEFSHEACGREFTYWMDRFGYRGCSEGENIAYGSGPYATPRSIFRMWMRSTGHRENILGPYEDTGLGLRIGTLEGSRGAHVWTQEFGSRTC
ncbi:MAG TPA: CAP domain-containing protein [Solirubrobacterales bacterium]|nr:CAP domain-containing protein [Solirubrobacterales bacterium]